MNNEAINKRLAVNNVLNTLILLMQEAGVEGFWMLIKLRDEAIEDTMILQNRNSGNDHIDLKNRLSQERYEDFLLMLRQFRRHAFADPKYDIMIISVTDLGTSVNYQ